MKYAILLLCIPLASWGQTKTGKLTLEPYPIEISCEVGFTADLPIPKATTTCSGEIHITQNEEIASGGCAGTLIRSFVFADDCGNVQEATQFVKLKDTVAPEFYDKPEELWLKPGQSLPVPANLVAMDNDGKEVLVTMEEAVDKQIITRTWTALDNCDNKTIVVQKIHLAK